MEIWIDASGLSAAHRAGCREAQSYGRAMIRSLLESGREHDYRFVGWPLRELGSVERFLAPLSRDARDRLSQPRRSPGPWALYSPIGFPRVEEKGLRPCQGEPPAIRIATILEERPRALERSATTVVTLTRSAMDSLAAQTPHREWDLRWVPPGLGVHGLLRVESQHVQLPEGDYVLASGVHSADPPESLAAVWRILKAFRSFRRASGKRLRLVFLGGAPLALRQAAACLGLAKEVSFVSTGFDDEFTRQRLIASAAAFVHVTRPDASWLLGAEAMRSGVPVLAPRTASAEEVWGEAAAHFAEGSTLEISRGLERLFSSDDLRRSLAKSGIARGQAFTWEAAAHRILDCVQSSTSKSDVQKPVTDWIPRSAVAAAG